MGSIGRCMLMSMLAIIAAVRPIEQSAAVQISEAVLSTTLHLYRDFRLAASASVPGVAS